MAKRAVADEILFELTPDEQGFWVSISAAPALSIEFHYFAIGVGGHQQEGELTLLSSPGSSRHFIRMHFTAVRVGLTTLRVAVARQQTKQARERKLLPPKPLNVKTIRPPSQAFDIQPGLKVVIPPSRLGDSNRTSMGDSSSFAGSYGFGPYRFGPYGASSYGEFAPYGFGPYEAGPYGPFAPYGFGPYGARGEKGRTLRRVRRATSKMLKSESPDKKSTAKQSGSTTTRTSDSRKGKSRRNRKPKK